MNLDTEFDNIKQVTKKYSFGSGNLTNQCDVFLNKTYLNIVAQESSGYCFKELILKGFTNKNSKKIQNKQ